MRFLRDSVIDIFPPKGYSGRGPFVLVLRSFSEGVRVADDGTEPDHGTIFTEFMMRNTL